MPDFDSVSSVASTPNYRAWQLASVTVGAHRFRVATKPGAFAHGKIDVAATLLAEYVNVAANETLVCFNCGSALLAPAVAQREPAARVLLVDRNVISAESARQTVAANALPHAQVFLGAGSQTLPPSTRANVVAIRIPHEKLALHQLLFDAFNVLDLNGRCYISGANNEGVKSAEGALKQIFGNARVAAHDSGHRVVMSTKRTDAPVDAQNLRHPLLDANSFHEITTTLRGEVITLFTRPGVFSWDHADEATEILASTMEIHRGESVLDVGCGAGALGVVAGRLSQTGAITLLDVDSESVRSAQRTASHAGLVNVRVLASDITLAVRDEQFDVVVTNPPFHVGKSTDLTVPYQFINESWEVLKPDGRLYLVANRTLPYERAIERRFGEVRTVHDGQRFKVLSACKRTE